jgi:hypothetical protein
MLLLLLLLFVVYKQLQYAEECILKLTIYEIFTDKTGHRSSLSTS